MLLPVLDKEFELFKSFLTDVMLNALDVAGHRGAVEAQHPHEFSEQDVPGLDAARNFGSARSESEAAVFLIRNVTVAAEPLDHDRDGRSGEREQLCDVRDTRVALRFDELVNSLEVVFGADGQSLRVCRHGPRTSSEQTCRAMAKRFSRGGRFRGVR